MTARPIACYAGPERLTAELCLQALQAEWEICWCSDPNQQSTPIAQVAMVREETFPAIKHWPMPKLVLVNHSAQRTLVNYIQEGASGCLPLTASLADLNTALHCLLQGKEYLHGSLMASFIEQMKVQQNPAGPRDQIEALSLQGLCVTEIAQQLQLSTRTVRSYLRKQLN